MKEFDGEKYIMERGLFADLAIARLEGRHCRQPDLSQDRPQF